MRYRSLRSFGRRGKQKGAVLVEASLSLILYLVMVLTLFDLGYVMYVHQTLADRARAAARYGALNPADTSGMKAVAVFYNSAGGSGSDVLGIQTSNVSATRSGSGTSADRVTITISGYRFFAVWPGWSGNGLPITVSIPVENN